MRIKYRPTEKALYSYKANEWLLEKLNENLRVIEEHGDLNVQTYNELIFSNGYSDRVFQYLKQKEAIQWKIADLTRQVEAVRKLRAVLSDEGYRSEEFRRDASAVLEHGYIEGDMKHESIMKLESFRVRKLRVWIVKRCAKFMSDGGHK